MSEITFVMSFLGRDMLLYLKKKVFLCEHTQMNCPQKDNQHELSNFDVILTFNKHPISYVHTLLTSVELTHPLGLIMGVTHTRSSSSN